MERWHLMEELEPVLAVEPDFLILYEPGRRLQQAP